MKKEIIEQLECIFIKESLHDGDCLMGSIIQECRSLGLVCRDDKEYNVLTTDGIKILTTIYYEKCKENSERLSFLQNFYDEKRVRVLQYESLLIDFHKMVANVLGKDYYNMANDVYIANRTCCEDITRKANKSCFSKLFEKFI